MRRLEKCTYFTSTIFGIALRKEKEHRKTEDTYRKLAPRTILDMRSLNLITHENAAYIEKLPNRVQAEEDGPDRPEKTAKRKATRATA